MSLANVAGRLALLGFVLGSTVGAAGCPVGAEDEGSPYAYGLFPQVAHSGFNAGATFRVLFATSAPEPKWSVADPSIASVLPSGPPRSATGSQRDLAYALVTMTKAGETTVTVTSRGETLTSRLVVRAYADDDMAAGKARYEAGSSEPGRVSCASCHAKPEGVDHSPLKMAGFDDATILGVIESATYPPSATGRAVASDYAPRGPLSFAEHRWTLSAQERVGVLAHLRSLPLGGL
jgi:hypothetical protein